ncbi:hypothetical protein D041_0417A, partial [Vibrio parahaemolyticus EKP-008]|jgi:hypothetical protein
MDTP